MVSWVGDGLVAGYDSNTKIYGYLYHLVTNGLTADIEGPTRLGAALAPEHSFYPSTVVAQGRFSITAGDITGNGITTTSGTAVQLTMFIAPASAFAPGIEPTPAQIYAAPGVMAFRSENRSPVASSGITFIVTATVRLEQNTKYWVMLMPTKYDGSKTPATDPLLVGVSASSMGRALSIWTNRSPGAPTITSPATGAVVAPGDSFMLTFQPNDADDALPADADRVNMDLAGVEFQYAAQPTPENPSLVWQDLKFTGSAGGPNRYSWSIKGSQFDDGAVMVPDQIRVNLGGEVVAGAEDHEIAGEPWKAVLPGGTWLLRCRTFDFGHPYPATLRPLGWTAAGLGPRPSDFPAVNTSPWSASVKVIIPAQVPPPLPLTPKNNVAVAEDLPVPMYWTYRNSHHPSFPQDNRTVQIRKLGDLDWVTVFSGITDDPSVILLPEHPAAPVVETEYLTDNSFESGGLNGWAVGYGFLPPSVPSVIANHNNAGTAHTGTRSLRLTNPNTPSGGVPTLVKRVTLNPSDTSFQCEAWVLPHDSIDWVYLTLYWVDVSGNRMSSLGGPGKFYKGKTTGTSWGGYVHALTGISDPLDDFNTIPQATPRPAGAVAVDIEFTAWNGDLSGTTDHHLDDVSFKGWSTATEAFTLEATTQYEWRVKTGDTDGEVSNYSEPARFWIVPGPGTGPTKPPLETSENATLGCGTHRIQVFRRGGKKFVGEIKNCSHIDWERKRDDISTAKIVVSGWDLDCGNLLASLQTWAYEVVIWRNNGFSEDRVWEGPITLLTYETDKVTIDAKDMMGYAYRRIMKQGLTSDGSTVVARAASILQNAFAPDDPNVLEWLTVLPREDDAKQYRSIPAFARTAFEEVDDMAANAGLDYTVIGRSILLWGTKHRIGTLPEFRDEHLGNAPIVSEYGMSMANVYAVADGNGLWGVATRGGITTDGQTVSGNDETYGLVEMLSSTWASDSEEDSQTYTQEGIQKVQQSFAGMAERSISDRYGPPVVVRIPDNTSLNPNTPISIQQLVPGVVIPLRSTKTLRTVVGSQKLDSIKVVEESGSEVITITMSAFNRDDAATDGGDTE